MLKMLLNAGNLALWPQISLVLFVLTFTAILLWVRRKGAESRYRYLADLVSQDGTLQTHPPSDSTGDMNLNQGRR